MDFILPAIIIVSLLVWALSKRRGSTPPSSCPENWTRIGNMCYENFPPRWTTHGILCRSGARQARRKTMNLTGNSAPITPPTLTDEQARAYLNAHPDLVAAFKDDVAKAKQHYREYGFKEGRKVPEPAYTEGQSVSCQGDGTGKVYRYTGGILRHYPSPAIASAWNPTWQKNIRTISSAECARLSTGPPMEKPGANPPPVAPLTEGMSVSCQGDGKVYRYTEGKLRHYPSPAIASAWNPTWDKNIRTLSSAECARLSTGAPMTHPSDPKPPVKPSSDAKTTTPVTTPKAPSVPLSPPSTTFRPPSTTVSPSPGPSMTSRPMDAAMISTIGVAVVASAVGIFAVYRLKRPVS